MAKKNDNTAIKPRLSVIDGEVTTTSLIIADHFDKLHKDVLKAIRNLECSPEFAERNFALCYLNNELQNWKPQPYYKIKRDGFFFLAMSFTGKEAARIREAYINAFNAMEQELVRLRLKEQTETARRDLEKELREAFAHSEAEWIVRLRSADKDLQATLFSMTVEYLCSHRAPAYYLVWHLARTQLARGEGAWFERSAFALSEDIDGMFSPAQINRAITQLTDLQFLAVQRVGGRPRSFRVNLNYLKRRVMETTADGSEHLARLPVISRERLPRAFERWLSSVSILGGPPLQIDKDKTSLFGMLRTRPTPLVLRESRREPMVIDPALWGGKASLKKSQGK